MNKRQRKKQQKKQMSRIEAGNFQRLEKYNEAELVEKLKGWLEGIAAIIPVWVDTVQAFMQKAAQNQPKKVRELLLQKQEIRPFELELLRVCDNEIERRETHDN